ncbi:hypothetical protein ACFP51_20605 [Streptomyces pratens]|uniref:Core-binding (CB) domain-containing protein n=1 Tax=Streptomyces pratens TaxID=887456 RepID=A0ABW1M8H3_9ACTN
MTLNSSTRATPWSLAEEPPARPRVDANTVLRPGQAVPTTADPETRYTERDLYVSEETARILDESDPGDSGPMRTFKAWCAEQGRVAVPCTTATFTEYSRHLMQRGLKVATIKNYMSLIRTAMPAGKKPDKQPVPAAPGRLPEEEQARGAHPGRRSPSRCRTWSR